MVPSGSVATTVVTAVVFSGMSMAALAPPPLLTMTGARLTAGATSAKLWPMRISSSLGALVRRVLPPTMAMRVKLPRSMLVVAVKVESGDARPGVGLTYSVMVSLPAANCNLTTRKAVTPDCALMPVAGTMKNEPATSRANALPE